MKNTWSACGRTLFWISWPALFLYLYVGRRTRVLIIAESDVLLAKTWYGSGKWNLLGGGIKYNETTKQCAIREVFEETGIVVAEDQLIELKTENICIESGLRMHCAGFVVELSEKPHIKRQVSEISDLAWFSLNDIASHSTYSRTAIELIKVWKSGC